MEKKDESKENEKSDNKITVNKAKVIIELITAFITALILLNSYIKTFSPFAIITVTPTTEKHADEEYMRYSLQIDPPLNPAKICVQPYILVTYKRKRQIIYLDHLYTQKAYIGENGTFPILKKSMSNNLVDVIKKGVELKLGVNNIDIKPLKIETDTIICFLYSEKGDCRYYKFNTTLPQHISRYKALKILNPKISPLRIDVNTVNQDTIDIIVSTLIRNIE